MNNENKWETLLEEGLIHSGSDRSKHDRSLSLLFYVLLGIIFLMLVFSFVMLFPRQPLYYAVDSKGKQIALIDVHQPNVSPPTLIQWATQAAIACNSYSYVNYQDNLKKAHHYFTANGWDNFVSALEGSGALDDIRKKRIVVSAIVTRAPVIVWQGFLPNGVYGWRLQLPMTISYQSLSEIRANNVVVSFLISRVDTTFSPTGVGIESMAVSKTDDII